ncbi:MAG: VPLPA-CTERM sorting domain-containing protein [Gammaproteobacteria bacterium]|nr:VPLPA-CTERM sorting domain-containing protein [Gammaproteobacteria bacterium]
MKIINKILLTAFISVISLPTYAALITGVEVADYADNYLGSSGYFYNWDIAFDGASPGPTLTDGNSGSYVFSDDTNAYIDLSFSNTSIYNGSGNDLAIFFAGAGTHSGNLSLLDDNGSLISGASIYFEVSIDPSDNTTWGDWTGFNFPEDDSPILVSYIDLDTLGLSDQSLFNNFRLEIGGASAAPTLLAGINTMTPVPVPATIWLFISGLSALGLVRRKQK